MSKEYYNVNYDLFKGQPMKHQDMVYKREEVFVRAKPKNEYTTFALLGTQSHPCDCQGYSEKYKLIFPN